MILHVFYFQKWKGLYYFTKMFDNYPNSKKLAKKQTFILATWQKEGQILRGKGGFWQSVERANPQQTNASLI